MVGLEEQIKNARLWAEACTKIWLDQILRVRMLERPTYEMTRNGLVMISDGLSDDEHEMIKRCEEAISTINQQAVIMVGMSQGRKQPPPAFESLVWIQCNDRHFTLSLTLTSNIRTNHEKTTNRQRQSRRRNVPQ